MLFQIKGAKIKFYPNKILGVAQKKISTFEIAV